MLYECSCSQHGIVETIRQTGCAVLWPVIHQGGFEHYRIVAPSRPHLSKAYEKLQRLGDARLERVEPLHPSTLATPSNLSDLDRRLSSKQVQALRLAVERGYYDIPRRIDAQTLAKEMGVSRSTFQEHLRKAENEILEMHASAMVEGHGPVLQGSKPAGRPRRRPFPRS